MSDSLIFDGSDDRIVIGGLPINLGNGAITILAIVKADAWNSYQQIQAWNAIDAGLMVNNNSPENLAAGPMTGNNASSQFTMTELGWVLIGWGKAAGTVVPQFHKYVYDTNVWTHSASTGNNPADNLPALTSMWIGESSAFPGSGFHDGNILTFGIWNSKLSDVAVEALAFSKQAWIDAAPAVGIRFDSASAISGGVFAGTATQTSRTGTTLDVGDVPTGPGGTWTDAAGPFEPLDISGLTHWYDAAQFAALPDDTSLASWVGGDMLSRVLTGNGTVKTNQLNGKPGMLFDGVDDYMTHLSGAAFVTGDQMTVFAVAKLIAGLSNGRMMAFNATDDVDYTTPSWCIYDGGAADRLAPYSNGELAMQVPAPVGAFMMTTWFDGTNHNMRINGAAASTPSFSMAQMEPFSSFSTKRFTLGSGYIGTPTSSGNYMFHEVVVYDRLLSGIERDQVEEYLNEKWFGVAPSVPQQARPDADVTTTGWSTSPLWSKVEEDPASDADYITATAS